MDPLVLRSMFQRLKNDRSNIEGIYQQIERYVVPYRGDFFQEFISEGGVNWKKRHLYDDTAIDSCIALSSFLHSGLTNPAIIWFALGTSIRGLSDNVLVRQWLDEVTALVFHVLQSSNFNLEIGEVYVDLVAYGTCFLIVEVEERNGQFDKLVFSTIPVREAFFEPDYQGNVGYFFRQYRWTPIQIMSKFPGERIPEKIKIEADPKNNKSEKQYNVIMAVYPSTPNFRTPGVGNNQIIASANRPYQLVHILEESGEVVGDPRGYYEMPVTNARWRGTVQSKHGNSPAMVCLSSILTLNEMTRMTLKAAEKAIDPPMKTHSRAMVGDINLEPGGENVVRDMKGLEPLESKARFDVSTIERKELQAQIRQAFFVDQLQLKESPAMTATEVNARTGLIQRLMGPSSGRIQYNLFDPLITRIVNVLDRYRLLPPLPQPLREVGGGLVVEYLGQAARAQSAEDAMAIERWMSSISAIAQVKQEVLDIPNFDYLIMKHADSLGVPAKAVNTDAAIKKVRKAREDAEAKAKEAAIAEQQGKAMQAMGDGQTALRAIEGGQGS